uniref:Uncharacterized protein n=1 Tax=Romanomermis culicivorax TaxID=13658 RepID=A0A915HMB6_ROMCU
MDGNKRYSMFRKTVLYFRFHASSSLDPIVVDVKSTTGWHFAYSCQAIIVANVETSGLYEDRVLAQTT